MLSVPIIILLCRVIIDIRTMSHMLSSSCDYHRDSSPFVRCRRTRTVAHAHTDGMHDGWCAALRQRHILMPPCLSSCDSNDTPLQGWRLARPLCFHTDDEMLFFYGHTIRVTSCYPHLVIATDTSACYHHLVNSFDTSSCGHLFFGNQFLWLPNEDFRRSKLNHRTSRS